jgi:hypothetical protein
MANGMAEQIDMARPTPQQLDFVGRHSLVGAVEP